jgi:hypothetical protein
LAFEAEAAFCYLALAGVDFHPVDPDVRGAVGADVCRPTHLKFTLAPATFMEMAGIFPDFQPCPIIELPLDAPLLGLPALLEEALEKLTENMARQ